MLALPHENSSQYIKSSPFQVGVISSSYPVEVKPTKDKGNGVFATRNIQRGEVCCWYDGLINPGVNCGYLASGKHGYNQQVDDKVLAGFPKQLRNGGVAQLCNDARTEYDEKDPAYWKEINVYEKCYELDGNYGVCFVAKRRIKKGEELLYSYGSKYWKIQKKREAEGEEDTPKQLIKNTYDTSLNIIQREVPETYKEMEQQFEAMRQELEASYQEFSPNDNLKEFLVRQKITFQVRDLIDLAGQIQKVSKEQAEG